MRMFFGGFSYWLAYHNLIQCTQAWVWMQFLTIGILVIYLENTHRRKETSQHRNWYNAKLLKCLKISLFTDSAILFFRFLSLFSVSEAVSPSDFAPPFNDSRQSLKGLNGAESCAGSDKKYLTAAQAAISKWCHRIFGTNRRKYLRMA